MDLIEALDTLEAEHYAVEAYHEMLADLGSSYFYGGAQGSGGYDAMTLARLELGPEPGDTPEVRTAREVVAAFAAIAPDPDISEDDEQEAERRHQWRMDGDGMDAPDGFYR